MTSRRYRRLLLAQWAAVLAINACLAESMLDPNWGVHLGGWPRSNLALWLLLAVNLPLAVLNTLRATWLPMDDEGDES